MCEGTALNLIVWTVAKVGTIYAVEHGAQQYFVGSYYDIVRGLELVRGAERARVRAGGARWPGPQVPRSPCWSGCR